MWKWLLYSLILFNVGFFAWNSQRGVALEPVKQNDDIDGAIKLLLLKEQASPDSEEPLANDNEASCYSVGPLARKAEARAVQKRLLNWNIETKRRVQKIPSEGFWVIIPAAKTRKAANKNIKKLKELGIRDYFLVATGSQKNAVSLGVFSKSSSARRRLKAMLNKGVKAKITSVDLPKRKYWLDWSITATALSVEQLAILQKSFKGLGKVSLNCSI